MRGPLILCKPFEISCITNTNLDARHRSCLISSSFPFCIFIIVVVEKYMCTEQGLWQIRRGFSRNFTSWVGSGQPPPLALATLWCFASIKRLETRVGLHLSTVVLGSASLAIDQILLNDRYRRHGYHSTLRDYRAGRATHSQLEVVEYSENTFQTVALRLLRCG